MPLNFADTAEAQVSYLYASGRLSGIDTKTTDYSLTYDAFGNILTIKAGNNTLATYEYGDFNGKLLKLTYGNGDYEEYIYDNLDRLVSVKFNGTVEYTLIYDANSRLYSMTEGATTHVYEYDSLDRLIRAYQKDANGNITVAVENTYDELGRAKGSKYDKVAYNPQQYSIDYKEDSNLISAYTMPGNKVNTYTYDAFERLIQKSHSSNAFTTRFTYLSPSSGKTSTVVSGLEVDTASSDIYYSYTYDNLGNITAVYKNGVLAEAYEYDALGQLTRADNVAADSTVFYQYDQAGNIRYNFVFEYTSESTSSIAFALADSIISYQYTTGAWGDMLTKYDGTTINYDAIGNPTNWRNASNLTWDARQLKTVTLSETQSLAFEYNSSGIRTRKTHTEAGGNTWEYEYILDGTRILRENIHAYPTGSPGAGIVFSLLYYYDDSGIASIDYEGTRYYYVKNLQGDVIGLVNGSGQFVVQYTYDAWGKVISTTGSMASTLGQYNPFRYRGYYYDRESGWYYLQSRYYDPVVGRFLNADGYVSTGQGILGYNMFAYCNNNPIMGYDPTGYYSWREFWNDFVNISNKISEAIFESVEIEVGWGTGIGGSIGGVLELEIYEDTYIGLDNGYFSGGQVASYGCALGALSAGNTYIHSCEADGVRNVCEECGLDVNFSSIIDCPHSEEDTSVSYGFVTVDESDIILGVSGSVHLGFGGHISIGLNIAELVRNLIK